MSLSWACAAQSVSVSMNLLSAVLPIRLLTVGVALIIIASLQTSVCSASTSPCFLLLSSLVSQASLAGPAPILEPLYFRGCRCRFLRFWIWFRHPAGVQPHLTSLSLNDVFIPLSPVWIMSFRVSPVCMCSLSSCQVSMVMEVAWLRSYSVLVAPGSCSVSSSSHSLYTL